MDASVYVINEMRATSDQFRLPEAICQRRRRVAACRTDSHETEVDSPARWKATVHDHATSRLVRLSNKRIGATTTLKLVVARLQCRIAFARIRGSQTPTVRACGDTVRRPCLGAGAVSGVSLDHDVWRLRGQSHDAGCARGAG